MPGVFRASNFDVCQVQLRVRRTSWSRTRKPLSSSAADWAEPRRPKHCARKGSTEKSCCSQTRTTCPTSDRRCPKSSSRARNRSATSLSTTQSGTATTRLTYGSARRPSRIDRKAHTVALADGNDVDTTSCCWQPAHARGGCRFRVRFHRRPSPAEIRRRGEPGYRSQGWHFAGNRRGRVDRAGGRGKCPRTRCRRHRGRNREGAADRCRRRASRRHFRQAAS